MEKSPTATQPHPAESAANERLATVKRKPVPAPTPVAKKEYDVEDTTQYARTDTLETLPSRPEAQRRLAAHGSTFISRMRTRWSLLSKRWRIVIVAGIIIVLALIIGLSAGLATRKGRTSNLPLPSNHGGPYTGDLTYYDPALGACGYTNGGDDSIVAVSHLIFDAVSTGSNPNANPLCGKKIRARREGKSVDLTVVDRCTGCAATDIDTTRGVFTDMADIDEGRVLVEWSWLEDVPGAAANTI